MKKKQRKTVTQKANRTDETKSIDFKLVVSEAKERLAGISKTEIQGLTKVLEENLPIYLPDKRLDNVDRLIISLSDDTMIDVFRDYDPRVLIATLVLSEANKNNLVTAYKGVLLLTNLENGRVMGNLKRFYEDEIRSNMKLAIKVKVGKKNAEKSINNKITSRIKIVNKRLKEVQNEHPRWKITECKKQVGEDLGISLSTVNRDLKKQK